MAFVAAGIVACQSGYPLDPTPCDYFCEVTPESVCDYFDPAECVRDCERRGMTRPECQEQFQAAFECLENTPREEIESHYCSFTAFGSERPCATEYGALDNCAPYYYDQAEPPVEPPGGR